MWLMHLVKEFDLLLRRERWSSHDGWLETPSRRGAAVWRRSFVPHTLMRPRLAGEATVLRASQPWPLACWVASSRSGGCWCGWPLARAVAVTVVLVAPVWPLPPRVASFPARVDTGLRSWALTMVAFTLSYLSGEGSPTNC